MGMFDGLGALAKQASNGMNQAAKGAAAALEGAGKAAVDGLGEAGRAVGKAGGDAIGSVKGAAENFDTAMVVRQTMRLPMVQVDRGGFLRKELRKYYKDDVIDAAIKGNPAKAGIGRDRIDAIAQQIIDYETNKVSMISFAAGMPGGIAMAATVPADIAQYFGAMLRVMQKLAYLYGFDDFELNEDEIDDATMNEIMVFLGVMFGVQSAVATVGAIAKAAEQHAAKALMRKALTKGTIYPIVKKVAQVVGVRMTKEIFAKGVSKAVPVVGGVVSGGMTYASFKPCALSLQKSFQGLNLSDPEFYKK
ncbi:hypothetical protein D2E24_0515 [Bifidobacterium samirii]|uniref:EcsC family protein n=1 Tax=Bifidobacterium samirii TaxID=2306974 RepID=A0A430FW39_9BIFI|nr:hypothetical protein D2E24_0515 [Bifidobacterium samirii]